MGASFFRTTYRGKSLSDAYKSAVQDAEEEYGHDSYNGTISTTDGVTDLTSSYKSSGKSLNDYIDLWVEKGRKRQCLAICIEQPKENTNKTKTQVEHVVTKGTRKWILLYTVYEAWNDRFIASFDNKGDAVKRAREISEKNQAEVHVKMEKKLDQGTPLTAKITYKKSKTEKDGKWVFFGWAAE